MFREMQLYVDTTTIRQRNEFADAMYALLSEGGWVRHPDKEFGYVIGADQEGDTAVVIGALMDKQTKAVSLRTWLEQFTVEDGKVHVRPFPTDTAQELAWMTYEGRVYKMLLKFADALADRYPVRRDAEGVSIGVCLVGDVADSKSADALGAAVQQWQQRLKQARAS